MHKKYLIILFIFSFSLFFSGCASQSETNQSSKESVSPVSTTPSVKQTQSPEEEYIKKFLDIYDVKAQYINSLADGKIPGNNFKIKNKGNKTLSEVEVTVYFKDKNGTTIAEDKYYPVLEERIDDGMKELKPNYIWRNKEGKFYGAKAVPDEWAEGKVEAKITGIKFKN